MGIGADDAVGTRVLRESVAVASEVLGENLIAAFALGSLAHGGFAPLVSDVDVALVLDELSADTTSDVDKVSRLVRERYPGSISERLSIFWADWDGVFRGPSGPGRLPAVDRLNLIESGRLLHGTDRRAQAMPPDGRDLVIDGAEFALSKFDDKYLADTQDATRLLAQGVRATTKMVLFPVRLMYTLSTERVGQNDDAAAWYSRRGSVPVLAQAAHAWRHEGIGNPDQAQALLSTYLVTMYLEFFDAYIDAVTANGRPDLAEPLQQRRTHLAVSSVEV